MNSLMRKEAEKPAPAEAPADVRLLQEIRDLIATGALRIERDGLRVVEAA